MTALRAAREGSTQPRRPIRLLVVSDYSWAAGGSEQFVFELLTRATRLFECRMLTWQTGPPTPSRLAAQVTIQFGDVRAAWTAMDWADVMVVVTSFNVRMLARLALDHLGARESVAITVVQTSAHSDAEAAATDEQERWLSGLAARSHATVAVSGAVRAALINLLGDVEQVRRVEIVENAARLSTVSRRARERKRISFIGRPHAQKGWPVFVRLVHELAGGTLQFAANTVSVAPYYVPDGVEHTMLLGDADLVAFFDATDLLIAPYLHADGLPLALLEAINCGVPIIGFDSPAVAPLLRHHGQAVVAPTYAALRDAVCEWQADRLVLQAPVPGQVNGWDEQIGRLIHLIEQCDASPGRGNDATKSRYG